MDLADQVVVITGASKGIGAAAARILVQQGAKVGIVSRDAVALEALAKELGAGATWAAGDITDDESITAAIGKVHAHFGRIDVLVANAGVSRPGTVNTLSATDFGNVIDTNLVGTYRTVRTALPFLKASRGYVLIVSSMTSSVGLPGLGAYSASKAGSEMLAHTLKMELKGLGVAVGSIHPWFTDTDMVRDTEVEAPSLGSLRAKMAPLRRVPGPLGLAGTTLTSEECGEVIAMMVRRRLRRRHVPRAAGWLAFSRNFTNSSAGEMVQDVVFGKVLRELDVDMAKDTTKTPAQG